MLGIFEMRNLLMLVKMLTAATVHIYGDDLLARNTAALCRIAAVNVSLPVGL